MWYIPLDSHDKLHSQLEYENFLQEQAEKKKYYEDIERIANGANKKATFSTIISIIALLISLGSLVVQILEYIH